MTQPVYISVASLELVTAQVRNLLDEDFDPTGDTVQMSFPEEGVSPSSWHTASWAEVRGLFYSRCLVGPGGTVTLSAGTYDIWVKIADTPEVPVIFAGQLVVQ